MARTTGPTQPELVAEEPEEGGEERTTRRLLWVLLGVLLLAAVALLVLLFWLLRPKEAPPPVAGPAGYPILVQTVIDVFGEGPTDRLVTPLGAAFDQEGQVWISDTGNSRVLVFTTEGDLVRILGEAEGPGKVYTPYGVAVDGDRGRIYVADWAGGIVHVYSTSGAYVDKLPADDQDLGVFGPNGFSPYAVQVVEGRPVVSSNDGLYWFDGSGKVAARWGGEVRGVEVGMFNFPDAFAVDAAGERIYVADTLNRRIVALDRDGRWLWVSGRPDRRGKIRSFWQLPRGIVVGPDGNLYVVDTFRFDTDGVGAGHFVVVSPDGQLISEFGRTGVAPDEFNFPEQIAVTPDGLYAVADRENNRVILFRLAPIPDPDQTEIDAYQKAVRQPEDVWASPTPAG